MNNNELLEVVGGISFTATLLNAITKAVSTIYDIAKRFGTSYYRVSTGNMCSN